VPLVELPGPLVQPSRRSGWKSVPTVTHSFPESKRASWILKDRWIASTRNYRYGKASPKRPIAELELGTRAVAALEKAGIKEVGQFIAKLSEGEESVLAIEGFGRKSLIDIKKKMRALGYQLPEVSESAVA
jgi:DNA-directed RNA polymerase alpha subunit